MSSRLPRNRAAPARGAPRRGAPNGVELASIVDAPGSRSSSRTSRAPRAPLSFDRHRRLPAGSPPRSPTTSGPLGGAIQTGREVMGIEGERRDDRSRRATGSVPRAPRDHLCGPALRPPRGLTGASGDAEDRAVPRQLLLPAPERPGARARARLPGSRSRLPVPRRPLHEADLRRVWAGPNAVLAFAREGYRARTIRPATSGRRSPIGGFRTLARRYWRVGLEVRCAPSSASAVSRRRCSGSCLRVRAEDLLPGHSPAFARRRSPRTDRSRRLLVRRGRKRDPRAQRSLAWCDLEPRARAGDRWGCRALDPDRIAALLGSRSGEIERRSGRHLGYTRAASSFLTGLFPFSLCSHASAASS